MIYQVESGHFFLNSVINTRYTTNGEDSYAWDKKNSSISKTASINEANYRVFTKENDLILDYFMGVGEL